MDSKERSELADMVAQAVIDRIEERSQVNMLVDMVMQRMAEIQKEEATSNVASAEEPQTHPHSANE